MFVAVPKHPFGTAKNSKNLGKMGLGTALPHFSPPSAFFLAPLRGVLRFFFPNQYQILSNLVIEPCRDLSGPVANLLCWLSLLGSHLHKSTLNFIQ